MMYPLPVGVTYGGHDEGPFPHLAYLGQLRVMRASAALQVCLHPSESVFVLHSASWPSSKQRK